MDVLQLAVYSGDRKYFITDRFTYGNEYAEKNFKAMLISIGKPDLLSTGKVNPSDLNGECGRVKIKIKPAEGNYEAQSVVALYLKPEKGSAQQSKPAAASNVAPTATSATEDNGDVPF